MLNNIAAIMGGGTAAVGDYESISTTTVGAGGVASVTFSSIPSTYTHLQIRATMLTSTSGVDGIYLRYNGVTSATYTYHAVLGEGAAARAQSGTSLVYTNVGGLWNGSVGSFPSVSIIDVLDYANTNKNKTVRAFAGQDTNTTNLGSVGLVSGLFPTTSAISSLTLLLSGSTTFSQYSSFALYGIK